jgi:cytochrome c-type biogenesis protein CcmF
VSPNRGPNYQEVIGTFTVTAEQEPVTVLRPSKRQYIAPKQPTSEAGIHAAWSGDLYAVLGDDLKESGYSVRLYFHPLVRLIWIGTIIMFIGGGFSLFDRRLRVGAPRKIRKAAATPAPAE